jgi:hypothetical protein
MINNNSSSVRGIVSKVWAFCNTLRDDGAGFKEIIATLNSK